MGVGGGQGARVRGGWRQPGGPRPSPVTQMRAVLLHPTQRCEAFLPTSGCGPGTPCDQALAPEAPQPTAHLCGPPAAGPWTGSPGRPPRPGGRRTGPGQLEGGPQEAPATPSPTDINPHRPWQPAQAQTPRATDQFPQADHTPSHQGLRGHRPARPAPAGPSETPSQPGTVAGALGHPARG